MVGIFHDRSNRLNRKLAGVPRLMCRVQVHLAVPVLNPLLAVRDQTTRFSQVKFEQFSSRNCC